jgi:polyhydroxyalkanoate synthase
MRVGRLAEYADEALLAAVAAATHEIDGANPFVMGHSLGGTLAAIFAALHPDRLAGLVLLSAPLAFHPGVSRFRDALVAFLPGWTPESDIVPGSLLSHVSALAAPGTFVWSRMTDVLASAGRPVAAGLRVRIEGWSLDEVPLSGALVRDLFMLLYRENRLCGGTLAIRGRVAQPAKIRVPVLAVANVTDAVAPPPSVTPFLEAIQNAETRLIEYPGEPGVVLQHLGILVGRDAFERIWPEIVTWVKDHY